MAEVEFSGSVPEFYDKHLGGPLFEPYALETAERARAIGGRDWLEIAAGTGRVTRCLTEVLPTEARLTVTDLQEPMLAVARTKVDDSRVTFQVADATDLPFEGASFDLAVSQFGAMFFPDKDKGHQEARRVLRAGGTYLLAVWGTQAENAWAEEMQSLMNETFPVETPGFYRLPFGYNDVPLIEASLRAAGFAEVRSERIAKPFKAESAEAFARGAIMGNPLGAELTNRGRDPKAMLQQVAERFAKRFGDAPMLGDQLAIYFTALV